MMPINLTRRRRSHQSVKPLLHYWLRRSISVEQKLVTCRSGPVLHSTSKDMVADSILGRGSRNQEVITNLLLS